MHVLQPAEAAVLALLMGAGDRHCPESGKLSNALAQTDSACFPICRGLGTG